jgi:hypothetical protein
MATGISLTIIGLGSERTITSNAAGNGRLFVINNGAALHLESNVTLKGRTAASTQSLITISNGSLTMQDGSKITGYTSATSNIGTINIDGTVSRFVMDGGEISGNRNTFSGNANSGIVIIANGGNFTMNSGTITGNTVAMGGCINVYDHASNQPTFNMNGGTITGNTNTNANTATFCPGGVYIQGKLANRLCFTMTGGSITGNTAPMGDVYKFGITSANNNTFMFQEGNGVIGTLTVQQNNGITTSANDYAQIKIGGKWTGSVQVLNLYFNNATTFMNVYDQYINKFLVARYAPHTLTSADMDNFKQINFMRSDLSVQNTANTAYVLVRSGADMGKIK